VISLVDAKPTPDKLFSDLIEQQKDHLGTLPPVHLWCPEKTGDMDLRIDREGRWIHEGREIKRPAMVKLFSTILKFEDGKFFLVTPVEKWQINVDIAPFFIIEARREERNAKQAVVLVTSTDDFIVVGEDHPLVIKQGMVAEEISPLVSVRDNLMGLISRSVYYQLIDWGQVVSLPNGVNELFLESLGSSFSLGYFPDE